MDNDVTRFYLGAEARKIFDEAQAMLKEIMVDGSLEARAIVGFYPANSDGDDIVIFDPVRLPSSFCADVHTARSNF
jgi:cobalamin-dependent methionine synthase I